MCRYGNYGHPTSLYFLFPEAYLPGYIHTTDIGQIEVHEYQGGGLFLPGSQCLCAGFCEAVHQFQFVQESVNYQLIDLIVFHDQYRVVNM